MNEVDGIARVVYDTTSKPPGKSLLYISLLLYACDINRGRQVPLSWNNVLPIRLNNNFHAILPCNSFNADLLFHLDR